MIRLCEDSTTPSALYHAVTDDSYDYVLKHGITPDSDGFIYLSTYPITLGRYTHNFQVAVPNLSLLYDWKDFWQEDGKDIDYNHEYDPQNPYYIYTGTIPVKYIKEV